jgi:sterol 3beta-glucosyltransferase
MGSASRPGSQLTSVFVIPKKRLHRSQACANADMRVVLTNFGSSGSVVPNLALAAELSRNGHSAVLALPPIFADSVESARLAFTPIGPDLRELQKSINEEMTTASDCTMRFRCLLGPLTNSLPELYCSLMDAWRKADVLVGGQVQPAGLIVHEKTGILPVTVQNVYFTNGGSLAFQSTLANLIKPFRETLGLHSLPDPIMEANQADLVFFAMSRHLRPHPSHWPRHYKLTGYFFMRESWKPEPELSSFFSGGPRPVVFTFGSMTYKYKDVMRALTLDVIRRVGCKAVIQDGWSDHTDQPFRCNVRAIGFAPHSWLFANTATVVHHGGSARSAAVFRAGVPSVFVPHWDQPIVASLAQSLGFAGKSIPGSDLSSRPP